MAVRNAGPKTLAARGPAPEARHLGAGAGFVDEHQALRSEAGLAFEPRLAPLQDVGTVLLRGVR